MYVYVALPTPVGVWSMALGLRMCTECCYYTTDHEIEAEYLYGNGVNGELGLINGASHKRRQFIAPPLKT